MQDFQHFSFEKSIVKSWNKRVTSSEMYVVDVRTVEIHRAGNKLRITVGIREHEQSFERNQGI